MPIIGVVIAVAVDVAAEIGAADLIATVAAGTIFADAAGTLTVIGDIAAGALGGLVGGAVTAGITGGDPLTGALEGAAGGALGGGLTGLGGGASFTGGDLPTSAIATDVGAGTLDSGGLISGLTSSVANLTGLPTQAVNVVLKTLTGAATGAVKSAATGGDPAQGALGGAVSGGVGAGLGAAATDTIDVNQIAADTGLPADVVKGVIQGLGQAATGAAASAATGGDPGIGAAADFASGVLPTALKYAEDGAKSLFNSLVSGGQGAITGIVDAAQTQIAGLQSTVDAALSQVQDAKTSLENTVQAMNANGDQLMLLAAIGNPDKLQAYLNYAVPGGVGISLPDLQNYFLNQAQPGDPEYDNGAATLYRTYTSQSTQLEDLTQQAQTTYDSAQQQVQQITETAQKQIAAYQDPNAAAAQYFDQAFQTAAQGLNAGDSPDQIQASLNAINPISSAQAGTPLSPSQYSGPYEGATITYQASDGSTKTGTVQSYNGTTGFTLTNGDFVGQNLVNTITAPSGPGTSFDFGGTFNPQTPNPPPTGQPTGTPQPGTTDTGASTGPAGGGTGTATGISGATDTVTAPTATNPDHQIMQLVGLTSPESAGADKGTSTGTSGSTNFNFQSGFNSAPASQAQQPRQPINIEPGSAALAQALSIPGTGPGLGGDIFGTKGQRTPIWNLESLRSEDTSGV